ncbi:MAG: FHA domain-containing protein, partial [Firmicutes bacterium]|nr:FHA domain-containing protein [Bacillota bacterium]
THWENLLGRSRGADLQLEGKDIRRFHAVLRRTEDGAWRIFDVFGRGGVLVNGSAVTREGLPLQSGDGQYKFRIMKNVQDKKYAEIHSVVCDVKLSDPYQPFLRPSDYANYSQNSRCVAKAAEITKGMTNDLAKIKAVYEYVCKTVKYDRQKAATVKSGYLPTPDETMATGKGICFDYASLAASMLRSQGIPTKVIFGYVSPDGLYHAWNMFYTKESGWVTVSYSINPSNWTRMDLTFSANGADGKFIGDGGNYKDVYMY